MNKIPKTVYFIFGATFLLVAIIAGGWCYDNYLKPIDCKKYSLDNCPARCAICPTCPTCSALACQAVQTCKDMGLYEPWLEQMRPKEGLPSPEDTIRQMYEPALMQLPGYDHFAVIECETTLCVKLFFKTLSPETTSRLPKTIENMPVVAGIIPTSDDGGASGGERCGIESCHGLDIVCGPNVPDVCTEIYQLGDGCRKYARCAAIDGACALTPSADFDACKACVQKCANNFATDNIGVFSCESECVNK